MTLQEIVTKLSIVVCGARMERGTADVTKEYDDLVSAITSVVRDAERLDALQRFLDENVAHPRGRHFAPIYRIVEGCLLSVVNLRSAIDAALAEQEGKT